MTKKLILISSLIFSTLNANAQLNALKKGLEAKSPIKTGTTNLTEDEVSRGLKEALNKGIEKGVSQLSASNGYLKDISVKIPMPEEASIIENKLRAIGQGKLVDDVVEGDKVSFELEKGMKGLNAVKVTKI